MMVLDLLLGILLLFLGRRMFWLFVGVAGFLIGIGLAGQYVAGPQGARLIVALAAGIIGAVAAVYLQRIAVAVAGFIIGGYVALELMRGASVYSRGLAGIHGTAQFVIFVIGGLISAALLFVLFNWALIVLSALIGAVLIIQNLFIRSDVMPWVFLALVATGILVQAKMMHTSHVPTQ